VQIWVRHRGAPDDVKVIYGEQVRKIGHGFLRLDRASIPYHRVLKVMVGEKAVFERKKKCD